MTITSSILFDLLKKEFRVMVIDNGTTNLEVTIPLLLTPQKITVHEPEEGALFICEWADDPSTMMRNGQSYLLIADRVPDDLPSIKSSIAVISTELSPMNLLYHVFDLFSRLQNWDLALKDAAYSAASFTEFFKVAQQLFPYPLALVDQFNLLEYTPDLELSFPAERTSEGIKVPPEQVHDFLTEPGFVELENRYGVFRYNLDTQDRFNLCINIHHRGQYLARLVTTIKGEDSLGIRQLFEHLGRYATIVYLQIADNIYVRRQNDRLHTLFQKMLNTGNAVSEKAVQEVFQAYGWDTGNAFLLHVIELPGSGPHETLMNYFCTHLEQRWTDSCAIANKNELIWIVNTDLSKSLLRERDFSLGFVYLIREFGCKAGISSPFHMETSLAVYYKQARIALKIGQQKRDYLWYHKFPDYLLDYVFSLMSDNMPNQEFCHPAMKLLAEEDQATGSELVKTLYYFLSCNFNTSQAADKMFVHRSTFIRQMKKIKELTGIDWNDTVDLDTLLWMLASFRLNQIQYPM